MLETFSLYDIYQYYLLLLFIFLTLGIIFQYILPISVIDYSFTNIIQTYNSLINYNVVNIANKMESGLKGIVDYRGQECNPEVYSTPPCRGPVPNAEIWIYDEDGKNVIAKTQTNDKGEYFISLEPGNYVYVIYIFIPNQSNKILIKENEITQSNKILIKENEITPKNLTIDKSIRKGIL